MALRSADPHPSRGGSRGYSIEYRLEALRHFANGNGGSVTASDASISRWRRNLVPLVQKGNGPKVNLVGEHKFPLVLFRWAYPKAHASVIIEFIAMNSSNPVIYSRGDITVYRV